MSLFLPGAVVFSFGFLLLLFLFLVFPKIEVRW